MKRAGLLCLPVVVAVSCGGRGTLGTPEVRECIDSLECSFDVLRQEMMYEYEQNYSAQGGDLQFDDGNDYVDDQVSGGCFITGIGHVGEDTNGNGKSDRPGAGRANQDSFGGNAMGMKDGRVRGQWQNTNHLGDVFHGSVDWLRCWHDGGPGPDVPRAEPNRAQWGGYGRWNHEDGYRFVVGAADYKEGKNGNDRNIRDAYSIFIFSPEGDLVYSENDCIYGNFQIHPPNQGHPYIVDVEQPADADTLADQQVLCPSGNW